MVEGLDAHARWWWVGGSCPGVVQMNANGN